MVLGFFWVFFFVFSCGGGGSGGFLVGSCFFCLVLDLKYVCSSVILLLF